MIIISTEEKNCVKHVMAGDTFNLIITRKDGTKDTLLSEEITQAMTFDYYCVFQFALDDGTVVGANLAGFFGVEAEMPQELKDAKRLGDLTYEQAQNFVKTSNLSCKLTKAA